MSRNKGWNAKSVTILVAVVFVGIFLITNGSSLFSISQQNGTGSRVVSTGTCPSSGFTSVSLLGSYIASNGVVQTPAVSASTYVVGASSPSNTTTTGSSATYVKNTISCSPSQEIYATYGDATSSSYYLQATPSVSATGAITQLFDTNLLPVAVISNPVFVNSQNGTYSSNAIYTKAGNSQTYTSTMNIQAGNGVYGNNEVELLFAYNSSEISSVTVTGNGVQSFGSGIVPASTTYQSGYVTKAYIIPSLAYYNQTSLQVIVKTNTLNANSLVVNPVQLFIKDSASYMNNGQIVNNAFINPITNTNIGHSTVDVSALSAPIVSGGADVSLSSAAIQIYS